MTTVSPSLTFSTHSLVIGIAQSPELLSLLLLYILCGQSYAYSQIALLLSYKKKHTLQVHFLPRSISVVQAPDAS